MRTYIELYVPKHVTLLASRILETKTRSRPRVYTAAWFEGGGGGGGGIFPTIMCPPPFPSPHLFPLYMKILNQVYSDVDLLMECFLIPYLS
jgi:hypothetical protein